LEIDHLASAVYAETTGISGKLVAENLAIEPGGSLRET